MQFDKTLFFTVLFSLIMIIHMGCSGSPASRFYLLQPARDIEQTGDGSNIYIGLSIIDFPEYLDRSQIITYISTHEIQFAEYDRWAEPLESNFKRVLIENLSALIPTNNISILPNERLESEAHYVNIEVIRFEYDFSGKIVLVARWNIVRNLNQEFELDRYSQLSTPGSTKDYNQLVEGMSGLVYQLSREIAAEVNNQISR